MLIRGDQWISRKEFSKKEFKLMPCVNKNGKMIKPKLVMNNEAPMLFMGYFGILS